MRARYMAIADLDGDTLPICGMDALVVDLAFSPAAAPASAPSTGDQIGAHCQKNSWFIHT
jgi:hypothetical protein